MEGQAKHKGHHCNRKELSEHYPVLTLAKQLMPTNISQMNKQKTATQITPELGGKASGPVVLKLGSLEPSQFCGDLAEVGLGVCSR